MTAKIFDQIKTHIDSASQANSIEKDFLDKIFEVLIELSSVSLANIETIDRKIAELKKLSSPSMQKQRCGLQTEAFKLFAVCEEGRKLQKKKILQEEVFEGTLEVLENIYRDMPEGITDLLGKKINSVEELYHDLDTNILSDIIYKKKSLKDLEEITDTQQWNFMDKVQEIIEEFFAVKYKHLFACLVPDTTFKAKLKRQLHEAYPTVGNNKLSVLNNKNKLEEIATAFKKFFISEICSALFGMFEKDLSPQTDPENIRVGGLIANSMLMSNKYFRTMSPLINEYEDFVEKYMTKIFQDAEKRKAPNTKSLGGESAKLSSMTKFLGDQNNDFIISDKGAQLPSAKNYPELVLSCVDRFVASLGTDEKQGRDIKNYILRLYRNGKDIRIPDMQSKYGMDDEIFTEKFIERARKSGLIFKRETVQEASSESTESKTKNPVEQDDTPEDTSSEQQLLLKKSQEYLSGLEYFGAKECICALELAGYGFTNKDSFTKQFDKLYDNNATKELAYRELKKNIGILNKKRNYKGRTINMFSGDRIFFEKRKMIDGIYSHDDYINRAANVR